MNVLMTLMTAQALDHRAPRHAAALAAAGHTVTVLTARAQGPADEEQQDGCRVLRALEEIGPLARKQLPARAPRKALIDRVAGLKPDVIHAYGTLALPVSAFLAEECQAHLVFDARELYSDMLQSESLNMPGSVIKRWARTERELIPRATEVIAPSDGIAMEIRRRYQRDAAVIRTVPDLVPAAKLDRSGLRRTLRLSGGALVVLYQGPLKQGRGLGVLVRALERVPRAELVVQADGPWREGFLRQVERRGVGERVHLIEPVAPDASIVTAAGADVGVVLPEGLSLNSMLSVPPKLYDYLMAGVPVLASDYRDLATIVSAGRCGITCDPSDVDAVTGALLRLDEEGTSGRSLMGARARRLAETVYSWNAEKRALLAIYERLAARSTA